MSALLPLCLEDRCGIPRLERLRWCWLGMSSPAACRPKHLLAVPADVLPKLAKNPVGKILERLVRGSSRSSPPGPRRAAAFHR